MMQTHAASRAACANQREGFRPIRTMPSNPIKTADTELTGQPAAATGASYVRVIGKAAAVLEILLEEDRDLTLSEIGRRLEMSRSTVHRLLATLERHRFVDRTDGAYRLGLQLFRLGSAVRVNVILGRVAQPELEALAKLLNLSSYLSVRDRDRALCVVRVDAGPIMATTYQVGDTLPLQVGAGPRILLAGLADSELARMATGPRRTRTDGTVAPPDTTGEVAEEVRRAGVAYAADDVEVGLAALGVPVRDPSGDVIAAVSVVALTDWFRDERRTTIERALRETAARIEARLST